MGRREPALSVEGTVRPPGRAGAFGVLGGCHRAVIGADDDAQGRTAGVAGNQSRAGRAT